MGYKNSVERWWHDRGHHSFEVPLAIVEKTEYDISGKNTQYIKREKVVHVYRKMRCLHCNRRKLKYVKTVTTEWSYR